MIVYDVTLKVGSKFSLLNLVYWINDKLGLYLLMQFFKSCCLLEALRPLIFQDRIFIPLWEGSSPS